MLRWRHAQSLGGKENRFVRQCEANPKTSNDNYGFVRSNPAELMMTCVMLELLGTNVGKPERIVKCVPVNFLQRAPSEVK
jgi:hypothetical protein